MLTDGWLWSAMLMVTSLAMTSRGRDVTEGGVEKLKIALIVPYDERRLFSLHKVLPAVHDALERHDVTDGLVPGHQSVAVTSRIGWYPVTVMSPTGWYLVTSLT